MNQNDCEKVQAEELGKDNSTVKNVNNENKGFTPEEVKGECEDAEQAVSSEEAEQIDLVKMLEEKQKEFDDLSQRYLRLAADFENFRRRTRQEMEEVRRTAAERLLQEIIPILDNFERAIASARTMFPDNVVTGIDMIYRQLWNVLSQEGLQAVESTGKPFDPQYHEAFEQVETDEFPDGTVTEEIQKGYLLHGKVIRPALVKVAKKKTDLESGNNQSPVEKEDDVDE